MTATDTKRFELHQYLRQQMGTEMADTLMEHLPPSGWSDLARTSDLTQVKTELQVEIADLRAELKGDIADLRNEMVDRFAAQTKWFLGFMITNIAAMTALVMAVILKA